MDENARIRREIKASKKELEQLKVKYKADMKENSDTIYMLEIKNKRLGENLKIYKDAI